MRGNAERFRKAGVRVAAIVQARPSELAQVCGHTPNLVCIADPERGTHRILGLQRVSLWKLLTSRELFRRRSQAAAAGHRQDWKRTFARESDGFLLPGAVLVAPGGRILWAQRGEHPGDLPPADVLLAFVQEHWDPRPSERRP